MKQIREQLKHGLIGEVPKEQVHLLKYVSATFVKHETDKVRILINYTTLNKGTVKVDFPLPNKEDLIAKIAGGDFYIAMDAKAAYNQVWICKSCQDYMTFVVLDENNNLRYFYPKRCNFGSLNLPGFYCQLSTDLFAGKDRAVYMDDLNIKGYNGKEEEAIENLEEVLKTAKENNVTFSFSKSDFGVTEIRYLGEIINREGRRPNPDRVKALQEFPLPRTRKQLRGFLGLYNFLAPLKRHASSKEWLYLNEFTSVNKKFKPREFQNAFNTLKLNLCKWLLLYPYDPEKLTYVMTDSSDFGLGGVILQEHQGFLRAVAVHSKRWPKNKKEIPSHVKEGLALVTTLKRFEHMLKQ